MIRPLLLFLIAGMFLAQASEPIAATYYGASAKVTQPHVTAELIPKTNRVAGGQPFDVILHLHMDPDWHTYWINPGDAGLPTKIDWTLPPGFTASPIQWPTPEKHAMGPLVTYGYGGDVYLLTTITPSDTTVSDKGRIQIQAHATWLVCQEACIPGKGDFTLSFNFFTKNEVIEDKSFINQNLFQAAHERLPVPNTHWDVAAAYSFNMGSGDEMLPAMRITLKGKPGASQDSVGHLTFFPEQQNVLATIQHPGSTEFEQKGADVMLIPDLQQNGETPGKLSGVLVSDQPLIGKEKAISITEFNVAPYTGKLDVPGLPRAPQESPAVPSQAAVQSTATAQPWLIAVLGAAFLGGLILNLMPCVLPVLSLKVFSLIRHAGENVRTAWVQGLAFTAGVVLSFWALAGLLLILRSAGGQLGWGFQMQSPGFVLALIFIFFILALNLFGVFELGTSLVGLDAKATGHVGGLASSFLNGALATLAATPCTAPFMGSSLGFAAQQPPLVALLIFTFLALGMAAPYLLLTIFPGALRFVPKPGAWMEAVRQIMGFLLMATVIFLVYIFGALVGEDQVPWMLMVLLLAGVGVWIYGRWGTPFHSGTIRLAACLLAFLFLGAALDGGIVLARASPPKSSTSSSQEGGLTWQPWSPGAVDETLAQGHPVFVDFTAAWCLSCKVNERVALENNAVRQAFADKKVVLFRADWTHADPEISKTLRQFNRDGVPLYLLYSTRDKSPRVLPEVLTPGLVLDALRDL